MQNNKTLSTSFNEEELFKALVEGCYSLDWAPDELVVRPEFYQQLELYSINYSNDYFENAHKNPLPTYYGIKIIIDEKLDKPYKFMRGGKEI